MRKDKQREAQAPHYDVRTVTRNDGFEDGRKEGLRELTEIEMLRELMRDELEEQGS